MPQVILLRRLPVAHTGLGSSPFARRYFGNNICSFFLQLLRCFTSPGSLFTSWSTWYLNHVSCLIRRSRDQRLLHTSPSLIAATPRPSSPLSVKASTIHPWVLLGTQKTINRNSYFFSNMLTHIRECFIFWCDPICTDEKTSLRMNFWYILLLLDDHTFCIIYFCSWKTEINFFYINRFSALLHETFNVTYLQAVYRWILSTDHLVQNSYIKESSPYNHYLP